MAQGCVDAALARFLNVEGVSPLLLRHVLAAAFRAALVSSSDLVLLPRSELLLGLQPSPRRCVQVGGLRLHVSLADAPGLAPHAVTPFMRASAGLISCPEVAFGEPDHLVTAARVVGARSQLALDALRAVLCEIARPLAPRGVITPIYLDRATGWQTFRMVEVAEHTPFASEQLSLDRARALDPACQPGDLLGLSMPSVDWLTPVLCWMGGAG